MNIYLDDEKAELAEVFDKENDGFRQKRYRLLGIYWKNELCLK